MSDVMPTITTIGSHPFVPGDQVQSSDGARYVIVAATSTSLTMRKATWWLRLIWWIRKTWRHIP